MAEWPLMRNERIMLREKSMNEPVIIGMSHFTPILIILVIGLLITMVSFSTELMTKRSTSRRHVFTNLGTFCAMGIYSVMSTT